MSDQKKYYKDIVKIFPIHTKKEKEYLNNIKEQIEEYDDISYDELIHEFGTPLEIVTSYYETIDSQYLLKRMNIKRIVTSTCAFILIIITLYVAYSSYIWYKAYEDYHTAIPAEWEETVETIEG